MAHIDPNDPRAPYQQIADDLRRSISAGEFTPGQRMKSSRDLAAVYGVAPMTVHQAIRVLRDEGLVDSWQGRGVFVRSADGEDRPGDLPSQIQDVKRRVDALTTHIGSDVAEQIGDLRRQMGILQAQLIDLYARTGHPYPHEQSGLTADRETTAPRRKTAGA